MINFYSHHMATLDTTSANPYEQQNQFGTAQKKFPSNNKREKGMSV